MGIDQARTLLYSVRADLDAGRAESAADAVSLLSKCETLDAALHHDLAMLMAEIGQPESAVFQMRKALALRPGSPEILNNLGSLLLRFGRKTEAVDAYRKAAVAAPDVAAVHANLGEALQAAGKPADAITAFRLAATLDPNLDQAWAGLANVLLAGGSKRAALGALRRAIELKPQDAQSCFQLGTALHDLRQFDEAIKWFNAAIAIEPRRIEILYGLAVAQVQLNELAAAIATLERCQLLDPSDGPVLHELGNAMFQLGCVEQAMTLLRRASPLMPDQSKARLLQNLAVVIPGSPIDDNASILAARCEYARVLSSRPKPAGKTVRRAGPIRVGYVSSFFHRRNWMKPVWPLINAHDRERFEIHLFSDAPLSQCVDGYRVDQRDLFHDVSGESNAAVAKKIAQQKIDLLIDLNGFSEPDRLELFCLRSAAVQAAWFNLYATSGMDCFDYLIGDSYVIPEDEERFYAERILRVPHCCLPFQVDYPVPEISAEPPMKSAGQITIGCLASGYKITDAVLQAWAEILHRCNARMLIRNSAMDRPGNRDHFRRRFAALGIASDRLQLEGSADHAEFLATYDRIDIAVDTFPYSGGTTTTEALWQGVPVVSFNGDRWASRTSVSLLMAARLGEFVAADRNGFVAKCVALATAVDTPARLGEFRRGIRQWLRDSPVCDINSFARSMETLYIQMVSSQPLC